MGQALPKDKAGSDWAGACPEKRVGREPVPGAGPQLRPGKGRNRGLMLPSGGWLERQPTLLWPQGPTK